MAKNSNPLYAVTNNGKDIEEVSDYLELIITKLGLTPVVEFLDNLLLSLFEMISSYAVFVAVQAYIDELIQKLESLMEQLDPVWTSFFPSALEGIFSKK